MEPRALTRRKTPPKPEPGSTALSRTETEAETDETAVNRPRLPAEPSEASSEETGSVDDEDPDVLRLNH